MLARLDDGCLMLVFKHLLPLPDLFNVGLTCWVSISQLQQQLNMHTARTAHPLMHACLRPPTCTPLSPMCAALPPPHK